MGFKPLYENVLVLRKAPESMKGSLHIPERAKEKPIECTVVAVGHGVPRIMDGELRPLIVKVGDRVLIGKYAGVELPEGTPIEIPAEFEREKEDSLVVLRESEILGVVSHRRADESVGPNKPGDIFSASGVAGSNQTMDASGRSTYPPF